MKLIVGLGNPGEEYKNTRHNIGYIFLDDISEKLNVKIDKEKFNGLYGTFNYKDEKIIFLKPLSYMNLSGGVIKKYVDYYKIDIEDILIIYDDMDLDVGKYKLRNQGSSGGHNGLKDIEKYLGTTKYKRLKIGISRSIIKDYKNYVLSKFTDEELNKLNELKPEIYSIIKDYLEFDFLKLMSVYNGK